MTRPRPTPRPIDRSAASHDSVFLAHVDDLRRVANRLTRSVTEGEDLLQDAFVRFVVASPDLADIENIPAYLTTLVRNVHVSHQRRRANQRQLHVALEDFDTAALALRAVVADQVAAREGLLRVCRHLALRKDTSPTASALLFRYVHGLFTREIACIARVPQVTVRDWLRHARSEAGRALTHPAAAGSAAPRPPRLPPIESADPDALLAHLRRVVFDTCASPCPAPGMLESWYARPASEGPTATAVLAHIVACERCLATATAASTDDPDDARGEGDTPGTGGDLPRLPRTSRHLLRRVRDVLEHDPRHLFLTANGLRIGSFAIEAPRADVEWTVRLDEPLAFIELMSEQDVCVLHLDVQRLQHGVLVHHARAVLAGGRVVELELDCTRGTAVVAAHYAEGQGSRTDAPRRDRLDAAGAPTMTPKPDPSRFEWVRALLSGFGRPLYAFAGLSVVLLASFWGATLWTRPTPRELLARAASLEQAPPPGRVRHRVVTLALDEAVRPATYQLDVWEAADGARASRIVDRSGAVAGGEWRPASGSSTYRPLGRFDDIWRAGLSARSFARLTAGLPCTAAEENDRLTIACGAPRRTSLVDLLTHPLLAQAPFTIEHGELQLAGSDRHAAAMTLDIDEAGRRTRVQMREVESSLVSAAAVVPDTFVAPAEPLAPAAPSAGTRAVEPLGLASVSVDVQLMDIIDRGGWAPLVDTRRLPNGALTITGTVDSDGARRALLAATARLRASANVSARVSTSAERRGTARPASRRREQRDLPAGPSPFEQFLTAARIADVEAPAVAAAVLSDAQVMLVAAHTLSDLLRRVPSNTASTLDTAGRAAWRAMVVRHARSASTALSRMDRTLTPFLPLQDDPTTEPVPADTQELAVRFGVRADALHREVVASFTASTPGDAHVLPAGLRANIRSATALAAALEAAGDAVP